MPPVHSQSVLTHAKLVRVWASVLAAESVPSIPIDAACNTNLLETKQVLMVVRAHRMTSVVACTSNDLVNTDVQTSAMKVW